MAESSLRREFANQLGQFNAGVIDSTLGLADLGAEGLAYLYNKATGSNMRPYNLSGMSKDVLGVESDPSSLTYAAGSIAPAVATGVVSSLRQLPNVIGRESLSYTGGELGGQIGQQYGGDTGGLVGSIAGSMIAPQGAVRSDIFAGPNSRTADIKAMEAAQELADRGVSPVEIKAQTGWEQNLDGKWMYEIPDFKASLNRREMLNELRATGLDTVPREKALSGVVGDYFSHPALFEAYPELAQRDLKFFKDAQSGLGGYVKPATGEMGLNVGIKDSYDAGKPLSSMIHEMQHAVSSLEGRSGGGSPLGVAEQINYAEHRDRDPYMRDWIEYGKIETDLDDMKMASRLRRLQDISTSSNPDVENLKNTQEYKGKSQRIALDFGKPEDSNPAEWTRDVARLLLNEELQTPLLSADKTRRMEYLLSVPQKEFEDEWMTYKGIADRYKEGNQKFKDIGQKYYDLRLKNPFEQYQLINDETLAREAQARAGMTAPSSLRRLYTSRVTNPDELWNAMRRTVANPD